MCILRGCILLGTGTTKVVYKAGNIREMGRMTRPWLWPVLSGSELSFPTCSRKSKADDKP